MKLDPKQLGRAGERRARWFYRLRGYRILGANVRLRGGELDLIVRRGRTIAFVEVKTRQSLTAGEGFASVDREKQRRLARLAAEYLTANPPPAGTRFRYDVVSILVQNGRWTLTHLPDAFRTGII